MNFNADNLLGLEYQTAVSIVESNGLKYIIEFIGKDRTNTSNKIIRRIVRVKNTPQLVLGVADFLQM